MLAAAIYTGVPEQAHRIGEVYPTHRAYLDAFQGAGGGILLIGPFSDRSGSMAIFRTRADAERFTASDPFVLEGIVDEVRIVDWLALDFIGVDAGA